MTKLYEGNEEYRIFFNSGREILISESELEELEFYCGKLENELNAEKQKKLELEQKLTKLEYLYEKVVEKVAIP